jgi:hypothetical protein
MRKKLEQSVKTYKKQLTYKSIHKIYNTLPYTVRCINTPHADFVLIC